MYRTVTFDSRSSAGAFLKALGECLKQFGRKDVKIRRSGGKLTFTWSPREVSIASNWVRQQTWQNRIATNIARIVDFEKSLPVSLFETIHVDSHRVQPRALPCANDSELTRIFDYLAFSQSLEARVNSARFGKYVVVDESLYPNSFIGIIGVCSPSYFSGSRDHRLNWPLFHVRKNGKVTRDEPAKLIRDVGLKSIFNISICAVVEPFNELRMGRLVAALCFSEEVIDDLESRYGNPILAMTTTGGWGGSAAQYEKIKLRRKVDPNDPTHIFVRTYPKKRSLNHTLQLVDRKCIKAAKKLLQDIPRTEFMDTAASFDQAPTADLVLMACDVIGLPRSATFTNVISNYLGALSMENERALSMGVCSTKVPSERSFTAHKAIDFWRKNNPKVSIQGAMPKISTRI